MSRISDGAVRLPTPPLRSYVGPYQGYRLSGFPPGTHIGMPSPYLTVIVTIGASLDLAEVAHPGQSPGRWAMFANGLVSAPCVIRHDGNQHGIQLAFTPLGARALFGLPAAALGAWIVDLADLFGPDAAELRERVSGRATWDARFDVLDEVLLRRLRAVAFEPAGVEPALTHAWRLLVGGRARVAEVAAEVGWSRRTLINRVGAEFGVTPKQATRIARFHRSHRMLRQPSIPPLARVAADCGYYDQAHLAREWREFAGQSPTAWRRAELFAFIQDRSTDLPADLSA